MTNIQKLLISSLLTFLPVQLIAGNINPAMVPIISYLLSDSTTISIPVGNQAPVARAGSDVTVGENRTVTLDGSNSSDDKAIVSYVWRDEFDLIGRDDTYTHIYALGSHALTLTVTDAEGLSHTDSITVTVDKALNSGANAGADVTVEINEEVTLNGTYSGSSASRMQQWKEGYDILGRETYLKYKSNVLGTHTILYQVKNNANVVTEDSLIVTVVASTNTAPVADAGADKTTSSSNAITITGTATDVDGDLASYEWSEDGTVLSTSKSFEYTPYDAGEHILRFKAIDSRGESHSDTMKVTVSAGVPLFMAPSHFIEGSTTVSPNSMQTLQAQITKSSNIAHGRYDSFKGDNSYIQKSGSTLRLINNSFNSYESMLAKYTQNGEEILVKLTFSTTVKPFTKYTINSLTHGDSMEIVPTANMYNNEKQFNAREGCEKAVSGKEGEVLCMPTAPEQEIYLTALSNMHLYYNSVDLMPVYRAWAFGGKYTREDYRGIVKTLDVNNHSQKCSTFTECRSASNVDDFIHKNLFAITLPNHENYIKTIHNPSVAGWGQGAKTKYFGEHSAQGFGSVSINQIHLSENFYNYFHHELMHGFSFSHGSGMTYGFSNVLSKAISKFYDYDSVVVSKVPKYVFDTKTLEDKKLLVSVYSSTNDTNTKNLNIEFLGAQDNIIKIIPQGNNQFVVELQNKLATRIFMRVFSDDSQSVMSKLLYPVEFRAKKELITHNGEKLYMVSNAEWRYIRDYAAFNSSRTKIMSEMTIPEMCRGWFGYNGEIATGAELELLHTRYANDVSGIASPIFVGKESPNDSKYDFKMYHNLDDVWRAKGSRGTIMDYNGNILCKPYNQ